MPEPQTKIRAFIALKTPAGWDRQLEVLQNRIRATLPTQGTRWVQPEQIHITVRFLGYIPLDEASEIQYCVSQACADIAPFELRCEGLGCFPSSARPRILWAGLTGDQGSIAELHERITTATAHFGQPPEDRPFQPHLTLARLDKLDKSSLQPFRRFLDRTFVIAEPWPVSEVLFMKSHLSSKGAKYEVIGRHHLK